MKKVLSIIIPCYNCEKFLAKALDSCISKKVMDKMEVIIVNDGSKDKSLDIALDYCHKYPNLFRVISQKNSGHGGALNTGIKRATGKYIRPIDADDTVYTENLEKFIEELEKSKADVIITNYAKYDINTQESLIYRAYTSKYGIDTNLKEIVSHWKDYTRVFTYHGITYRNQFYQKFAPQLSEKIYYEDYEYATITLCYAKRIRLLDFLIYRYRVGDVNQSVSDQSSLKNIESKKSVVLRLLKEYGLLTLDQDSDGRKYYARKVKACTQDYLVTALLLDPNKRKGRKEAKVIMKNVKEKIPAAYQLLKRKYHFFKMMNICHINKKTWMKITNSKLYRKIRKNRNFE